eukprot:352908-Chlamydomonas_euryale.AAC.8
MHANTRPYPAFHNQHCQLEPHHTCMPSHRTPLDQQPAEWRPPQSTHSRITSASHTVMSSGPCAQVGHVRQRQRNGA